MNKRWRPSVTVAAVIEHEGRFLLVEEQTPEGLKLNNPAGHLEPGETPEAAVVREALEETGRDFAPEALLGVYLARFVRVRPPGDVEGRGRARPGDARRGPRPPEDITYLRIAYSGRVGEPLPDRALDPAIVRTLWLTRDEIVAEAARLRSPLVLRCIDDHLAGRRLPLDAVIGDASLADPLVLQALPRPAVTKLPIAPGASAPAHRPPPRGAPEAGTLAEPLSRSARRRARKRMQGMQENDTERAATGERAMTGPHGEPGADGGQGAAAAATAASPASDDADAAAAPDSAAMEAREAPPPRTDTDAGTGPRTDPGAATRGATGDPEPPAPGAGDTAAASTAEGSVPAAASSPDAAAAPASAGAAQVPSRPEPTLAETAAALAERFPALFAPGQPRPIKLRIQTDIQARAHGAFTRKQLSIFLHRHTTSTAYLRALVASPQRFDLDGQPSGEVLPEHVEAAKVELERRRQIVMQRRAQQGPRPGHAGGARAQGDEAAPTAAGAEGGGVQGAQGPEGAAGADGPPPRPPRGDRPDRPGRPNLPPRGPRGDAAARGNRLPRPGPGGRPDMPGARPARPERGAGPFDRSGGRAGDRGAERGGERGGERRPGPDRWAGRGGPPGVSRPDRSDRAPERGGDRGSDRAAERAEALITDPERRERAQLLRSFESSPLTAANFSALKGLALAEFEARIAQARREREERQQAGPGGS